MGFLYYYSRRKPAEKEIYKQIYDGLCSYASKIKVNKTSADNAFALFQEVLIDHPELSVVDPMELNFEYSPWEIWLLPGYWFPKEYVYNNHMRFLDECAFIVNRITTLQATDIEKEIAIHDFMVKNIRYGDNYSNSALRNALSQSAFSTLFDRMGVCKGISMLFKCLADLVGLNVLVIEGELYVDAWGPHAWNMINIDGHYYHLDITQDLVTFQDNGMVVYNWVNLADDEMATRYRWDNGKYPRCDEKKWGYYEWNKLLVRDSLELKSMLRRQIQANRKLLFFRVVRGTALACKSEADLAYEVVGIVSKELHMPVSVNYIFDMKSGKCVVEV